MTSPGEELLHTILDDAVVVEIMEVSDVSALLGEDGLDAILVVLDKAVESTGRPQRGTPSYRAMLEDGATTVHTGDLVSGLAELARTYEWRGLLDFQAVLIRRIARVAPSFTHDEEGNVQIGKILRLEHSEADMLEAAVQLANDPEGQQHGYDFTTALKAGTQLQDNVNAWVPYWQGALNAACQGDEDGIRPHLARLPGLRDPDRLRFNVQTTFTLSLAHLMVSTPVEARQQLK